MQSLEDRLADLKQRLIARDGTPGMESNVLALRKEIARLEAEIQRQHAQ